jgi:hypothetical protein
MRLCKDCGEPTGSISDMRQRCVKCMLIQRKITAKACKEKYQYHKQPKNRYVVYKRGAERRGYTFNITQEEFIEFWNKPCHYCNESIKGIGIDRKDNNVGYTTDNTVSCCSTCNFMKGKLTYQSFVDKCIEITKCFTTVAF